MHGKGYFMRKIKKVTALVLSVVTALTVGSATAFAEEKSKEGMKLVQDEITYDGKFCYVDETWISDPIPCDDPDSLSLGLDEVPGTGNGFGITLDDVKDCEMTLAQSERTDDGDYYYVDETWISESVPLARASGYKSIKMDKTRTIYLNDNSDIIKLAVMNVIVLFIYSKEENYARIADSYYLSYSCIENQTYPKVTVATKSERSDVDTLFAARYAVVEYEIDLEIAKGEKTRYGMWLEVNVNGKEKYNESKKDI